MINVKVSVSRYDEGDFWNILMSMLLKGFFVITAVTVTDGLQIEK